MPRHIIYFEQYMSSKLPRTVLWYMLWFSIIILKIIGVSTTVPYNIALYLDRTIKHLEANGSNLDLILVYARHDLE
jgi:hypothetical protein